MPTPHASPLLPPSVGSVRVGERIPGPAALWVRESGTRASREAPRRLQPSSSPAQRLSESGRARWTACPRPASPGCLSPGAGEGGEGRCAHGALPGPAPLAPRLSAGDRSGRPRCCQLAGHRAPGEGSWWWRPRTGGLATCSWPRWASLGPSRVWLFPGRLPAAAGARAWPTRGRRAPPRAGRGLRGRGCGLPPCASPVRPDGPRCPQESRSPGGLSRGSGAAPRLPPGGQLRAPGQALC